ncbi:MAG: hypothetical protein ABI113_06445 [Mucilaginibacter sp.]
MTLKFLRSKLLSILMMAAFVICSSCTHERQQQPITWLYSYGEVEMLNGNVKKLIYKPRISELPNHLEYTFDKKGNVVTLENIYQGGINTIKYNTVYKNGKKVESIGFDIDKSNRLGDVYKYDNYEYITSVGIIMNGDKASNPSTDIYRFLYDKAGYLTEQQEYGAKGLIWINKFKYLYNEESKITGMERARAGERSDFKHFTKDTIRYILFDSKNNWLKAIRFRDTITRKITYY